MLEMLFASSSAASYRDERVTWYMTVFYGAASLTCVVFAGLMSGLTIGLSSIDVMTLEVLKTSGTDEEQEQAKKIEPIIKNYHQLLVTLLLWNCLAMEMLPIFMHKFVSEVIAVLLSVSFILLFGEIVPQALCARYGMQIGASLGWFVRILMWLSFPIAYPAAKILDFILGQTERKMFFKRKQLQALLSMQTAGGYLAESECKLIGSTLELKEMSVLQIMTPLENVFMVDIDAVLTDELIERILKSGHYRFPVYQHTRQNIIGIILLKDFINAIMHKKQKNQEAESSSAVPEELRIANFCRLDIKKIPRVTSKASCWDLLSLFQNGVVSMAIVYNDPGPKRPSIIGLPHFNVSRGGIFRHGDGNEHPSQSSSSSAPDTSHFFSTLYSSMFKTPIGVATVEDVLYSLIFLQTSPSSAPISIEEIEQHVKPNFGGSSNLASSNELASLEHYSFPRRAQEPHHDEEDFQSMSSSVLLGPMFNKGKQTVRRQQTDAEPENVPIRTQTLTQEPEPSQQNQEPTSAEAVVDRLSIA